MLLTGVLFLSAAVSLLAQTPAHDGDEKTAVKEVVQKYVDARERNDAQAIESLFTADADQLVSTGEWRKGRGAVVRGTLASSQTAPGKRNIRVESVRFVSAGVALADGRYEITGPPGGQNRSMWTTFLLKREPQGWRIAAIRNMLPAPLTPAR